jgi:hypothetical protein
LIEIQQSKMNDPLKKKKNAASILKLYTSYISTKIKEKNVE